MKILLVEPSFRRRKPKQIEGKIPSDDTLWYPPLSLMKLSRFHKSRGDAVTFVSGCDKSMLPQEILFTTNALWDRVYITTLFTFDYKQVIKTINFYIDAVGGTMSKIYVGGIMASLMANEIFEATGIRPFTGILHSPSNLGLNGEEDIDLLPLDYDLLDPDMYALRDTYYGYTTRGCVFNCAWCGVPTIEPEYQSYIDIKPSLLSMRAEYGDKPVLKLMDNNLLASKHLKQVVNDLVALGYAKGEQTDKRRSRVIDFNQGLDATYLTEDKMKLISQLNIRPMRIAFDRAKEKPDYVRALKLAHKYGVTEFSNYMLYNYRDTPHDLYDRMMVNVDLNEKWGSTGSIYSYPMRFAPINGRKGLVENQVRDAKWAVDEKTIDWLKAPVWTKKFTRSLEVIKGATHGAISPTPSLARRAIGHSFTEFVANLYMPEMLLRNRNKHEEEVFDNDPSRTPGTGLVEEFRAFILGLLKKQNKRFYVFHNAVAPGTNQSIKDAIAVVEDKEMVRWLKTYIKR